MLVTLEGMTISDRELQPVNALSPMLVTLEGMTMLEREPQPENAPSPIRITLEGITIFNRELQSINTQSPMLVTLSGMTISNRELQSPNALLPILVILAGMTILDRERQPENALLPMLVTLEGMTILVRERQPEKALSPMLVTQEGITYDSIFWFLKEIKAGEVGYIAASIKSLTDIRVGDTITQKDNPAEEPLPGYKKVTPMVYCGLYPIDGSEYENLKIALEKLQLNDAALEYEPETSAALGFGFRCGFLGLLHLEIIEERLDREFDLGLITTAPSVIYKVHKTSGEILDIYNPVDLPPQAEIAYMEEPIVTANIMTPKEYVGNIMDICQNRRGTFIDMKYLDDTRVTLIYDIPLNEIIYDFFDTLKSRTKGYASFDYEFKEYRESKLVKLDIHVNGEPVDALSFIVFKDNAYTRGKKMVEKLKEVIPRQLFAIPLQAVVGGTIIARETISAMRKDVLAKCYGGDITRKKKLLEKQKRGKKRMRQIGNVEMPQEAFLSVLKLDDE